METPGPGKLTTRCFSCPKDDYAYDESPSKLDTKIAEAYANGGGSAPLLARVLCRGKRGGSRAW